MSWLRSELLALGLSLCLSLTAAQVELNSLLNHRQLLHTEMSRLYMQPSSPETQLLLEDLKQRDHQLQMQIELLEGSQDSQHNLALNLTADFEHLQRKLDDLKQQLELINVRFAITKPVPKEDQRDGAATPPSAPASGISSYFWTPLLAMPEFPPGSIPQQQQQQQPSQSPSLIKRLMAILRPSSLRSQKPTTDHLLSAHELLPQLQMQREYLDEAIKRLEVLASKKNTKKT